MFLYHIMNDIEQHEEPKNDIVAQLKLIQKEYSNDTNIPLLATLTGRQVNNEGYYTKTI